MNRRQQIVTLLTEKLQNSILAERLETLLYNPVQANRIYLNNYVQNAKEVIEYISKEDASISSLIELLQRDNGHTLVAFLNNGNSRAIEAEDNEAEEMERIKELNLQKILKDTNTQLGVEYDGLKRCRNPECRGPDGIAPLLQLQKSQNRSADEGMRLFTYCPKCKRAQ